MMDRAYGYIGLCFALKILLPISTDILKHTRNDIFELTCLVYVVQIL